MRGPRRRRPWYEDFRARLRFEGPVREVFPQISVARDGRGVNSEIVYELRVEIPHYEPRRITIRVANLTEPVLVSVHADGPDESPHRYANGSLCMWHPDAPASEKWLARDGLVRLIQYARLHLFREAFYRETGEWLGPEASHSPPKEAA